VPVISVGNLTTGGTGKTPVVIELLRAFRSSNPGLLTRGHGRTTRERVLFFEEDETITPAISGDEAQLCMREAHVPIGIGADRYVVGQELIHDAGIGVLFLDDGFQHLQLHRNFDLVLIDALRPFGGSHLVPLGSLREPLEGLRRANAFLITRSDEVPNTRAIESVLRRYNPVAPVFRARTISAGWRDQKGQVDADLVRSKHHAVAFCGLGNPRAFWRTLRKMSIQPLEQYDFDDHHQYRPAEIRRLAQRARDIGAEMLLTTAKDQVNLDPGYPAILQNIRLCWLEIRTEIEGREELLRMMRRVI
jgi:tetraacyldisaccharide 4'-kinase